jgi:FtsH-binding integral membrane protein
MRRNNKYIPWGSQNETSYGQAKKKSGLFSNGVWDRREETLDFTHSSATILPQRLFIALLTFWVVAGLVATAAASRLTCEMQLGWPMLIGCMLLAFLGVFVSMSETPIFSLLGYALIVLPFGLLLGPAVAQYTQASVIKVLGTTVIVTVGCGGIGVIYPKSLESWGGFLFGALLLLILGQFTTAILGAAGLPVEGAMTAFDWIGALLFSAYIIYDMNRAMRVPRTLDNSIDCAIALYLDIINLFLYLLQLMGKKD